MRETTLEPAAQNRINKPLVPTVINMMNSKKHEWTFPSRNWTMLDERLITVHADQRQPLMGAAFVARFSGHAQLTDGLITRHRSSRAVFMDESKAGCCDG